MNSLNLNNAEKEELMQRTLAMSPDEKLWVLRFIPTTYLQTELVRREEAANNTLNKLRNIDTMLTENMTLHNKEEYIKNVRQTINQEDSL